MRKTINYKFKPNNTIAKEEITSAIRVLKSGKLSGFLGNKGGKAKKYCNIDISINEKETARIQEAQIFLGHYIFEQVENKLYKKNI